jgi:cysteinyl-tRNA synthetase
LIFPHHENEIAQSECATGKPFARYWVHNAFVNIHAEKMSKSLGNVLTVRDLLGRFAADTIKLFLLGTHYRAPVDFSEEALISAAGANDRLQHALAETERFRAMHPGNDHPIQADGVLMRGIDQAKHEFLAAMDDDFNTPRALAAMFGLVKDINVSARHAEGDPDEALGGTLCLAGETLRRLGSVLGGLLETLEVKVAEDIAAEPSVSIQVSQDRYHEARGVVDRAHESGQPLPDDMVRTIVEFRRQLRHAREWAAADEIRAWLADHGVIVDDTAKGVRWHLKSSRR